MYSPNAPASQTTTTVPLIASGGQYPTPGTYYVAGTITFHRLNGTTEITVALNDGWRWAGMASNLKINPYTFTPVPYVAPGKFKWKYTVPTWDASKTVSVKTAAYYGVHCDVQRVVGGPQL
jgi:hypothetical protein